MKEKNHPESNQLLEQPHNKFFMRFFGIREHAASFFQQYLPAGIVSMLDWRRLRHNPGSFVNPEWRDLHTDLLFEVPYRNKEKNAFVYLLYEHQSTRDPWITLRLLEYSLAIWNEDRKSHPRKQLITPIIPIVLYHGKRRWEKRTSLREILDVDDESWKEIEDYIPNFRLKLIDIGEKSGVAITGGAELRVALLAFRFVWNEQFSFLVPEWISAVRELDEKGDLTELLEIIEYLLGANESVTPEKMRAEVSEIVSPKAGGIVMTAGQKLRAEGKAEGRVEGKAEGKAEILLKQIQLKFGSPSETTIRRVTKATEKDLDHLTEHILTAKSIKELFSFSTR